MYNLIVLNKEGVIHSQIPFSGSELLIGRNRGNAIVLPSTSVSRQHARVYGAQGRAFIQDLKSSNGILVDGQRIQDVTEITPTSQIRIGEFVLVLQDAAGGPAGPPAGNGGGYAAGPGAPPPPPGPPPHAQVPHQTPPPPTPAPQVGGPGTPPPGYPGTPPSPMGGSGIPATHGANFAGAEEFPRLIGINGRFEGEEWVLSEQENTVGRTEDNFILLPDPSVSRNHARVVCDENGNYTVYDLRSSNSTAVNRKRITQHVLRDGDLVSFGNVAFRFVHPGSAGEGSLSNVPRKGTSKGLLVVLGLFLGVLLLGMIIVGVFFLKNMAEQRAKEERRKQVEAAITAAREEIKDKDWAKALAQVEAALTADPENSVVIKLKEKVELERQAKEKLKKAEDLLDEGNLEGALEAADEVPKKSVYAKDAVKKKEQIQDKIDEGILEEGLEACSHRKYKLCHEKLSTYLDRNPDNADAVSRLRYAEGRMRRRRIKFERWEMPKVEGEEADGSSGKKRGRRR